MTFHSSRSEMMTSGSVVGQGQVSLSIHALYVKTACRLLIRYLIFKYIIEHLRACKALTVG